MDISAGGMMMDTSAGGMMIKAKVNCLRQNGKTGSVPNTSVKNQIINEIKG
jgi:hypothetical protein